MGMLIDGVWHEQGYDTSKTKGRFVRSASSIRNWITPDGSPGPGGEGGFKAEPGRYHLYVSHACPWAHRTMIMRSLKGLQDMISVSVVNWHMGADGWTFEPGEGVVPDPVNNAAFVRDVYTASDSTYTGRVTVPILWDLRDGRIVNNESSEIIRMLNSAFDEIGARGGNYYPEELRSAIDTINERVYETLNNGVYKCGFAASQAAYDENIVPLFATLDWLEDILSTQRYVADDVLTEADIRLFTTLVRFDSVYHGHFKCNIRRIIDYPNLWGFVRELYQMPDIRETIDLRHIKHHYYGSHAWLNPSGVVPVGPEIDFDEPHGRNPS